MSELQVVVCELGGERYGLDISRVYEIIRVQPITAVPQAPAFVEGVINLRGRVIPVVELATRFGLPAGERTKASRIVVAETGGVRVGLIVDGVSEVLLVPDEAVEPTPPIASSDAAYLRGIAKLGEQLVTLLDLDGLFGAGELGTAAAA
ncbi:MAG TPA: chemotaxis protein CheW [Candidatus Limnocylindrales bacterium]